MSYTARLRVPRNAVLRRKKEFIGTPMYIIAIAWLYVTILMAATEKTITAGLLTFIFYGLLPCALLLWLLGVKHRRHKQTKLAEDDMGQPDRAHTQSDQ